MIETAEGIEKMDEIISTPGLDAVYIGPTDLALSLGLPPVMDNDDPKHVATVNKILETCRKHKVDGGDAHHQRQVHPALHRPGLQHGDAGQRPRCDARTTSRPKSPSSPAGRRSRLPSSRIMSTSSSSAPAQPGLPPRTRSRARALGAGARGARARRRALLDAAHVGTRHPRGARRRVPARRGEGHATPCCAAPAVAAVTANRVQRSFDGKRLQAE